MDVVSSRRPPRTPSTGHRNHGRSRHPGWPPARPGASPISGAKNAALPVMAATLLAPGVHRLRNVPDLLDTRTFGQVLETLGAQGLVHGGDVHHRHARA